MAQLMLQQKGKVKEGLATDVEALAYLYTAGLSVQLDSDYSEIFMYLTRKAFDWQGKKEIPEYLHGYETLDDRKITLLNGLKKDIYEAQERHYREKKRVARSNLKNNEKENRKGLDYEQLKLF